MRAYLLKKSGKPDSLQIHEVAEPDCKDTEIKVKVRAIGINYAEILSRQGKYSWAPKRPYIPGMEASGEVVEVGKKTSGFAVGDRVIVGGQYGSYAEYVCAPEHLVFPAFAKFTDEENAAVMVNFITAWVALKKLARVSKEDKVLIQAAAGGVGTAAVQIANSIECEVIGTASSAEKLELIKTLGASHAINYIKDDFETYIKRELGGVDVVLEVVGGEVFRKSKRVLNPFGRLVVAGYASNPYNKYNPVSWYDMWKNAPKMNVMDMAISSMSFAATHIGYLTQIPEVARQEWMALSEFVSEHGLKPLVNQKVNFESLPEAHEMMESRKTTGKIVVTLT